MPGERVSAIPPATTTGFVGRRRMARELLPVFRAAGYPCGQGEHHGPRANSDSVRRIDRSAGSGRCIGPIRHCNRDCRRSLGTGGQASLVRRKSPRRPGAIDECGGRSIRPGFGPVGRHGGGNAPQHSAIRAGGRCPVRCHAANRCRGAGFWRRRRDGGGQATDHRRFGSSDRGRDRPGPAGCSACNRRDAVRAGVPASLLAGDGGAAAIAAARIRDSRRERGRHGATGARFGSNDTANGCSPWASGRGSRR